MSDASRDTMRELVPGYALGALTSEETRAFESALHGSPELEQELAEYREVMGLLAAGAAQAPGPGVRQRVMERVRALPAAESRPPGAQVRPLTPRRSITPTLVGMGLAASILLAAGLYLKVQELELRLAQADSASAALGQRLAQREATLNAILEPGVQLTTLTATGTEPPIVQVFWNRATHKVTLHSFRLPPAPSGRTYQLWLMRRGANPLPSQLFDTEPDGHGLAENIDVPAGESIVGFAVSIEPASGSEQPTTAPILFANAASE
jgi:anti-sigma-K factor RskA